MVLHSDIDQIVRVGILQFQEYMHVGVDIPEVLLWNVYFRLGKVGFLAR